MNTTKFLTSRNLHTNNVKTKNKQMKNEYKVYKYFQVYGEKSILTILSMIKTIGLCEKKYFILNDLKGLSCNMIFEQR